MILWSYLSHFRIEGLRLARQHVPQEGYGSGRSTSWEARIIPPGPPLDGPCEHTALTLLPRPGEVMVTRYVASYLAAGQRTLERHWIGQSTSLWTGGLS